MEPRILVSLDQLSEKTLRMMDKAMKNYGDGVVSDTVDLKEMKRQADALPD